MESKILKPAEIREITIKAGETKAKIGLSQGIILGILAGAFVAIGGAVASVGTHSITNVGLSKLVGGALFPIGLILVIICGAELFTGNSLMFLGVLEGRVSFKKLLRNWIIVYISNFVGAIIISFLVFQSGMLNLSGRKLGGSVIKVAAAKGGLSFGPAFASGILCNMLVCLAVWGATASKDVIGKVVMSWFPVMTFVTCGFEHCIANMYFLTVGIFAKSNVAYVQASGLTPEKLALVSGKGIFNNLLPVTLGNIVGGAVLIAGAYFLAYKSNVSSVNNSYSATTNK
ncbi:formate/nitrite transporter family protein [Haloimpatiens lingqiaonensis]|uniref:formate/nitrite transporter family protein n=1 Tax=Haloimpatiens lingqiaonensis TaxID=1380675 RepID=UPI0010FE37E9|nr:formate/nitrite transporter family protein [Haloimpatiens lingqiaonensis]